MRKQKVWHSIEEIFTTLNNCGCNYIVMRNFEGFMTGQVLLDGHDDIDLLCDNPQKVCKILNTKRRFLFPTVNSYYIQYNNSTVQIDIRFVGDGYYDMEWQKDMLKHKTLVASNIYVMDHQNYFYSLIYHATIQKHFLSEEYLKKLVEMSYRLGMNCNSKEELMKTLFCFMKKRKYFVTMPCDPGIIFNISNIDKSLIRNNYFWFIKRKVLNALKRIKWIGDKYV